MGRDSIRVPVAWRCLRWLYAFPVFCTIYRLRTNGHKLSPDQVRLSGFPACLIFDKHPIHPTMRASLLDPATRRTLDYIDNAQIKKVTEGVLVAGFEAGPGAMDSRQTWWCVPVAAG